MCLAKLRTLSYLHYVLGNVLSNPCLVLCPIEFVLILSSFQRPRLWKTTSKRHLNKGTYDDPHLL